MNAKWAVFDVDGTLLPGASMERVFFRYLLFHGKMPLKNFVGFILNGVLSVMSYGNEEGLAVNKAYLKGLPVSDIDMAAEQCFQENIAPALSKEGVEKLGELRREKYKVILLSGSPSFLVDRLASVLRPDFAAGCELDSAGGTFTGKIAGLHPFGERKKQLLLDLQPRLSIDFADSIVFANTYMDVPHMELFGTPVAVNPDQILRKHAVGKNWRQEKWI